jgi:uncharacterized membrane protein YfcA
MPLWTALLLFVSAALAGALNSVAGGGSFISFPALLFAGITPISANATSTVALWPGSAASVGAYRNQMPHSARLLVPLVLVSLAGGWLGAMILIHTPQGTFMRMVPWLLLGATLLFAFNRRSSPERRPQRGWQPSLVALCGVLVLQFVVSVYGGFFGGGIGILMLGILNLLPVNDIHAMNGIKMLLAAAINGVAVVTFVVAHVVYWPAAFVMIIGAGLGGYAGAYYAMKLPPLLVRRFVIFVGFAMSAYFLWKR